MADPTPQPEVTTRVLSRYVTFYREKIRNHDLAETRGVIRQIQRLLTKGITLQQIQNALRNYANDPFRKNSDPRLIKHIRSFFTQQNILDWQTPIPTRKSGKAPEPVIAALEAAERFANEFPLSPPPIYDDAFEQPDPEPDGNDL